MDNTPAPIQDAQTELPKVVAPAILHALREIGPNEYFTNMARSDPVLFHKWAALVIPRAQPSGSDVRTVVNVVTAIPRTPLDALPPGFEVHAPPP